MLTRLTPDLPLQQDPALTQPPVDGLQAQVYQLQGQVQALARQNIAMLQGLEVAFALLNAPGALTIADAYIQATKGLAFPTTDVASTDPNTLDDYEEGTWTPTILGTTTAGTQTYVGGSGGRYTKIGRLVHIEAIVVMSAKDAATAGNIRIGGLPFTASASSMGPGFAVALFRNWNLAAGYSQITLQPVASTTQIQVLQGGDNIAEANLAAADIIATTGIAFGGCYTV